jgi:hypothetical protein
MILLACIGFIQGCANNQVEPEQATHINIYENIMKEAPLPVEFGTTCSYRNNGGNSGSCVARQQSVGFSCSCMSADGRENGYIN